MTINVPPRDIEKKAIPKAAAMTEGVSSFKWKRPIYHLMPSPDPGRVIDLIMITIKIIKSAGTITLLVFSIPFRSPLFKTRAQKKMTNAVMVN